MLLVNFCVVHMSCACDVLAKIVMIMRTLITEDAIGDIGEMKVL